MCYVITVIELISYGILLLYMITPIGNYPNYAASSVSCSLAINYYMLILLIFTQMHSLHM